MMNSDLRGLNSGWSNAKPSRPSWLTTALAAGAFLGASHLAEAQMSFELEIHSYNDGGNQMYFAWPFISDPSIPVTPDAGAFAVRVQDPAANHIGVINGKLIDPLNFDYTASSLVYSSLADLRTALDVPGWSLTYDVTGVLGAPVEYLFDVDLLDDFADLGSVNMVSPALGSNHPDGSLMSYEWTGPAGMDQLDFSANTPNYSYYAGQNLGTAETTWSPGDALSPGSYEWRVRYKLNLLSSVVVSTPANVSDPNDLFSWGSQGSWVSEGRSEFTVVPEPASYAAIAGVFLMGFSLWRRHARQTA